MSEQKEFSNLTGKILIASPYTMEGNIFYQSVIYVIHHSPEGSVGLIVNHPVDNMPIKKLFKRIKKSVSLSDLNFTVNLGGPVDIERGFFLHSNEYNKNLLFKSTEDNQLSVSSNIGILQDIANGIGPQNAMFFIGYTGWSAGQMEFEIENNLWIISDSDEELIFSPEFPLKWEDALNRIGVSSSYFSPSSARC
jgi:putative transcriptional regulator